MSHTRRPLESTEWGILIGCSTCPGSYHWPQEIRRESDGKYRCLRYCADPTNPLEDSRKIANANRKREERQFRLPGAPDAGYWDDTD